MRAASLRLVAASMWMLVLTGCTSASPDPPTYEEQTLRAVTDTLSQVATVALVVESRADGEVMKPYAVSVARDSETAASSAADSYATLEPPRSSDDLYERTSALLGDAGDLLTRARIEIVRDDGGYGPLVKQLDGVASKLEAAEKRLQ